MEATPTTQWCRCSGEWYRVNISIYIIFGVTIAVLWSVFLTVQVAAVDHRLFVGVLWGMFHGQTTNSSFIARRRHQHHWWCVRSSRRGRIIYVQSDVITASVITVATGVRTSQKFTITSHKVDQNCMVSNTLNVRFWGVGTPQKFTLKVLNATQFWSTAYLVTCNCLLRCTIGVFRSVYCL